MAAWEDSDARLLLVATGGSSWAFVAVLSPDGCLY